MAMYSTANIFISATRKLKDFLQITYR